MMRQLAVFCLVFSTRTVTLAQAATEWRPNVAEDNKAASWEDTQSFLVNYLKMAHWNAEFNSVNFTVQDVSSPEKCLIVIHQHYSNGSRDFVDTYSSLDLKHLDPLSIRVLPSRQANAVVLFFDGTSGTTVENWTKFTGVMQKSASVLLKTGTLDECLTSSRKCDRTTGNSNNFRLGDFEIEVGHRTARALMHAALLCGGTKAVSPF
jgi:hypothetical protein